MIIFIYGDDTYRARRKLNEFKDKFLREIDPSGNGLNILDGEKVDLGKLNSAINSSSLLSKKSMIVVEDFSKNKSQKIFNEFLDYLKKKEKSDNIIIFLDSLSENEKLPKYKDVFFSFLKKQKYAAVFNSLSNTEATAWAKKEIESRGGKITAAAATLLASFLGSDLWRMSNEIDKLINYKAGQKLKLDLSDEHVAINNEDVESLVRGNFDEKIFALTDAISNKNKSLAIKLLEDQIDAGLTDAYLLSMIARQFKILLRIRQALDSGMTPRQISSALKIHPFVAQKGMAQARNFTLHVLRDMLKNITKIEYKMKTGKSDVKSALDLLLVSL